MIHKLKWLKFRSDGVVHQARWLGLRLRGSGEPQGNLRMSNNTANVLGGDQKMVHDLLIYGLCSSHLAWDCLGWPLQIPN